jgi:hypothetical protein
VRRLVAAIALVAALSGNGNPVCPREGGEAVWAGEVKMSEDAPYEMLYRYTCTQWMHKFWSNVAPGEEKRR